MDVFECAILVCSCRLSFGQKNVSDLTDVSSVNVSDLEWPGGNIAKLMNDRSE